MNWEMNSAIMGGLQKDVFLEQGWEPFAVYGGQIWFRRPVVAEVPVEAAPEADNAPRGCDSHFL